MQYTITHRTKYMYSSPASVCQNIVTLTPREEGRVRLLAHRIRIRPNPMNTYHRTDFFGNLNTIFSIDENHDELLISSVSRVSVEPFELNPLGRSLNWRAVRRAIDDQTDANWLEACHFLYDSPRIARDENYAAYARQSFDENATIVDAAEDLNRRIYQSFEYDTKATETHTPTREVFEIRKGVCQDFAHVMVSCVRSIGLPARYVSGYLRTIPPAGKPRLVGADQSHAWVAVYCGEATGWVEFDPTNNCLCSTDHIPIAWGRDYTDVVPVRGAYLGGGDSSISVSVDVSSAETTS